MGILTSILHTIFGCWLFGIFCLSQPNAQAISVESYTSPSTPNSITVMTTVNGSTTEQTVSAPYGVKTSIVETYNGTTPVTEATTTPLTQAAVKQIQQQELASEMDMEAMQNDMDQLFSDQQKIFNNTWGNF